MGPLQRALTELEKSQGPLREQIPEACRILRLDINAVASDGGCQEEIQHTKQLSACLGRDEWVLRWLLKILNNREHDGRK